MTRTRTNVWSLQPGDQTLTWYARAIASMQAKPINDPTSWRYQAAIHEYRRDSDPLADPGDALPSGADQEVFWNQCQHGSWYFLPWHRMYLFHFEAIVAAEVARLGGPADWALPYWNYSDSDAHRLLPDAFRSQTLADGSPNPLYVAQRSPGCNDGQQFSDPSDTDVTAALSESRYVGGTGGTSGFGGPQTRFQHGGGTTGLLEATPHGNMHVAVGGTDPPGWMSSFNTAGLDPIFWIHHCNLDRLWQVWLNRDARDANPTTPQFLSSVAFKFHDASGNAVTMHVKDVLDTAGALSYVYDDTSDPLATGEEAPVPPTRIAPMPAEMIGATAAAFDIQEGVAIHALVAVRPPTGPASGLETPFTSAPPAAGAAPARVFLNVENVSSDTHATPFDVYLNVPAGADPAAHKDLLVGRMPMFGLVESSAPAAAHSGSGLHYVFDVTKQLAQLSAQPGWDPSLLRVSFVAARPGSKAKVRVGRVSFYVE